MEDPLSLHGIQQDIWDPPISVSDQRSDRCTVRLRVLVSTSLCSALQRDVCGISPQTRASYLLPCASERDHYHRGLHFVSLSGTFSLSLSASAILLYVLSFSVIVFSDTFQLLGSNSWSEARTLLTASKPVEHGAPTSGQRVMTPLSIGVHGTNWRCLQ